MRLLLLALFYVSLVAADDQPADNKFYSASGKWFQVSNINCVVWNSFPREHESVTWSGTAKDGRAHGKGILQWFTNSVATTSYEGELKNGLADGHGVVKAPFENFEGEWKQGRLLSTNLTINYAGGNWYKGGVKDGFKDGQGEELMTGGHRYVGQFKLDRFDGPGELILPNGDKISGSWKASQLDGIGTYRTKDGVEFKVKRTEAGIQRL